MPNGIKAMQSPSVAIIETIELPFRTPIIKVDMQARAMERISPSVPERYEPIAKIIHPNKMTPFNAEMM